ncbi:MAG TPA: hypothetical protein VNW46_18760 [Gemmatimonadaceae bacterium]|jgi:hypothetical protein|nr:hypothetical protein [Gemmatimonadaceae bacterium]
MHRLTVIASVICCTLVAGACGSSSPTAPKDTFNGSWLGVLGPDTIRIAATQTGTAFSGTGTVSPGGQTVTFVGTSTPPTLNGTLTAGTTPIAFTGSYVTPDSIVGVLSAGGSSAGFSLKKQ